jgi:hypothetical protein
VKYNNNDYIEELEDFLWGTFHQDIESPEHALKTLRRIHQEQY